MIRYLYSYLGPYYNYCRSRGQCLFKGTVSPQIYKIGLNYCKRRKCIRSFLCLDSKGTINESLFITSKNLGCSEGMSVQLGRKSWHRVHSASKPSEDLTHMYCQCFPQIFWPELAFINNLAQGKRLVQNFLRIDFKISFFLFLQMLFTKNVSVWRVS